MTSQILDLLNNPTRESVAALNIEVAYNDALALLAIQELSRVAPLTGTPTVSQAELDDCVQRLDRDFEAEFGAYPGNDIERATAWLNARKWQYAPQSLPNKVTSATRYSQGEVLFERNEP